jgi:hypothetical protein
VLSAHTPPCWQAGAEFSFDFLLLLLLASAIAFMGLLESSSVVLGINSFPLNNRSLYKTFFSLFMIHKNSWLSC